MNGRDRTVLAYQGLRALTNCGALMASGRQPSHLKAAIEAGWAEKRSKWNGVTFVHCYTLKIERRVAMAMLDGPTRQAA